MTYSVWGILFDLIFYGEGKSGITEIHFFFLVLLFKFYSDS